MAAPERCGRHRQRELGIFDDRFCLVSRGWRKRSGRKAPRPLSSSGHAGGHWSLDICGEQPIAPSAIPHVVEEVTTETIMPQAMSKARIEETTAQFVQAAVRARAAGFDCVEIHAGTRLFDIAIPHPLREPPVTMSTAAA